MVPVGSGNIPYFALFAPVGAWGELCGSWLGLVLHLQRVQHRKHALVRVILASEGAKGSSESRLWLCHSGYQRVWVQLRVWAVTAPSEDWAPASLRWAFLQPC